MFRGISALCQFDLQAFGKRLTIWFSHLTEKIRAAAATGGN